MKTLWTLLIVMAFVLVAWAAQEWRDARNDRPKWKVGDYPRFPPGYGYPSWKEWQRVKMARFHAPLWKRLRWWWSKK